MWYNTDEDEGDTGEYSGDTGKVWYNTDEDEGDTGEYGGDIGKVWDNTDEDEGDTGEYSGQRYEVDRRREQQRQRLMTESAQ